MARLLVGTAFAQHAADDAVLKAEDAFGLTVGTETVGLYDPTQIRGFNPQVAGNVRIEGLYFDQQGALSGRVVEGSAIRVGASALGYPLPAPTGIVDFELRHASKVALLTAIAGWGPFETRTLDLDGQLPIAAVHLNVPAGIGYRVDALVPGSTSNILTFGAAPQWSPSDTVTLRVFFDRRQATRSRTMPEIYLHGSFLPRKIPPRYFGQDWTNGETVFENYGALIKAGLTPHWSLAAGLFRSIDAAPVSYSELYIETEPTGASDHSIVGYPAQWSGSVSGETRLTGTFTHGAWHQEITVSLRARSVSALYGGSDVVSLGRAWAGQSNPVPPLEFAYSDRTEDRSRMQTVGVAYHGGRMGWADFSVGLEKVDYSKVVSSPGILPVHRGDRPWQVYGNVSASPLSGLSLYAGYSQGLEDSGVAPEDANNRGAVLPATRTSQRDAGVRWSMSPSMSFIGGVFAIRKPYFNINRRNFYEQLGEEERRGVELSLTGQLAPRLNVVAGAVWMGPRVSVARSEAVDVGPRAVGANDRIIELSADYGLKSWPAASIDCSYWNFGSRVASLDNRVRLGGTTSLDVGARYRLKLRGAPATVRVLLQNITNTFSWELTESAGLSPYSPRSAQVYITLDI